MSRAIWQKASVGLMEREWLSYLIFQICFARNSQAINCWNLKVYFRETQLYASLISIPYSIHCWPGWEMRYEPRWSFALCWYSCSYNRTHLDIYVRSSNFSFLSPLLQYCKGWPNTCKQAHVAGTPISCTIRQARV